MSYSLRPYQQKCVDFTIERFKTNQKPMLIVAPTGSGKSHIIAGLSNIWSGKVLVLTLSKELCEQDSAKMEIVMGKENAGMYSASWGRKEVKQVTVATIQSAYKHPEIWEDFDLIIADECEMMCLSGMLGKLVSGKKVIGLTATPYGTVGSRQGKWFTTKIWPMHKIKTELGWFWQPVEYCITEQELLDAGYLCPLKIYSTPIDCWKLKLNSNGSEFTQKSIGEWVSAIYGRIAGVMTGAEEHGMCHSGIVFMPSVESCEELVKICQQKGISAAAIHSKTPPKERDKIVDAHKAGELTWLINQNVATRGFDNPRVDCLIIARPSNSLRLHRQMLGRCCRIAEGKECGYVLDLTNNCKKFGNLTDVKMGKNGWADTILLKGRDISGTEVSRLNLVEARKRAMMKKKEENGKQ